MVDTGRPVVAVRVIAETKEANRVEEDLAWVFRRIGMTWSGPYGKKG